VALKDLFDEMDLYGFEDFEDNQKLLLLNEAYLDVVTREPWPFMERVVEFVIPSGVSQVSVNSEFKVRVSDDTLDNSLTSAQQGLFPYSSYFLTSVLSFTDLSNDIVMLPERADVVEKSYRIVNDSSTPSKYYFVGEDLFLYPAANGDSRYRLYFIQTPVQATIASDTSAWLIPSRHHSIVLYGALVKAFLVNDDPQASLFQNMFEQRYQQMRNDVWMRQYDRTDRIHVVSDSYDWGY
jgi:hypothetical protein